MNDTESILYIDTSFDLFLAYQNAKGRIHSKSGSSDFKSEAIDALYLSLKLPSKNPFEKCVVGIGPGSFTGLRTGIAYAQGLCIASHIPIFTVSSFEGLIPDNIPAEQTMALIPAKKEHFYVRSYLQGLPGYSKAELIHQSRLFDCSGPVQTLILAEPQKFPAALKAEFSRVLFASEVYNFKKAINTALQGTPVQNGVIKPSYVQLPAAELNRLKRKC